MRSLIVMPLLVMSAVAQTPGPVPQRSSLAVENPAVWLLPDAIRSGMFTAQRETEACAERGRPSSFTCVVYRFPATPYLGKWVRFRAQLRTWHDASRNASIKLRVNYASARIGAVFNSAPLSADAPTWCWRDVYGFVPSDAAEVSVSMRYPNWSSFGRLTYPSFGAVGDERDETSEQSARLLVAKFADLRKVHDGDAVAALYTDDGAFCGRGGAYVHGRPALAALWGGVEGNVRRTVESVELPEKNVAIVYVSSDYAHPNGRHHEVFILARKDVWRILYQQPVD
jgi:hypothetical protein